MAASLADKITRTRNGARPNSGRVTLARISGGTTLTVDNLSGWPTASKVHFVTYRIDTNNNPVAGTQIDWAGIVTSSTSIGSLTLQDGTDNGNAIGDVVEMLPTAAWGEDLAEGLEAEHNRNGTHSNVTATSLITTGSVTAGNGLTVSAGSLSLPSASISQSALPLGSIVQAVTTTSSAVATGTTIIPLDDTIPQITEGTEFITLSITPKSATNVLVISANAFASSSVNNNLIMALFQDSTANALAVSMFNSPAGNNYSVPLTHTMVAGTTSSTTFRIRIGGNAAGTITFNGVSGGRLFGSSIKSSLTILEYKA